MEARTAPRRGAGHSPFPARRAVGYDVPRNGSWSVSAPPQWGHELRSATRTTSQKRRHRRHM